MRSIPRDFCCLPAASAVALAFAALAALAVDVAAQAPVAPSNVRVDPTHSGIGPQPTITCPDGSVDIHPGSSIQPIIDGQVGATTFCLRAGVHSLTSAITPKTGNTFVGEFGAVVDGSQWTMSTLDFNQGLFRAHNQDIDNVTIRNLVIQHSPMKGIHAFKDHSDGWLVENCDLAYNRIGVLYGHSMTVRNSILHHNTGDDTNTNPNLRGGGYLAYRSLRPVLENSHLYANGPEQKFLEATDAVFRNNNAHDGKNGLWCDGCDGVTYTGNRVENFTDAGIFHEVSRRGTIQQNVVLNSTTTGIFIAGSQSTVVSDNTVENNFRGIQYYLDCIRLTQAQPFYGEMDLRDNVVRDNTINVGTRSGSFAATLFLSSNCTSEQIATYTSSKNLEYRSNHYTVPSLSTKYWVWGNISRSWDEWQALGHDVDGSVN